MVIIIFKDGKLVKVLDSDEWIDLWKFKDHVKDWLDDALPT